MNEIKIRYSKDALKFLSKLDKKSVGRIRDAIVGLTYTPLLEISKPCKAIAMGANDSELARGELSTETKTKKRLRSFS